MNGNLLTSLLTLGYRDYIAARVLLNSGYVVQGFTLASTAVEKYLKIPLLFNQQYKTAHLSDLKTFRKAFEAAGQDLSAWISDSNFLEVLSSVYKIRYYDKLNEPISVGCFPEQFLGELDYTVAKVEGSVKITNEHDGKERSTLYKTAVAQKDKDLYLNNYLLNGMDKKQYMEQPYQAFCLYVDVDLYGCDVLVTSSPISNEYSGQIFTVNGKDAARTKKT